MADTTSLPPAQLTETTNQLVRKAVSYSISGFTNRLSRINGSGCSRSSPSCYSRSNLSRSGPARGNTSSSSSSSRARSGHSSSSVNREKALGPRLPPPARVVFKKEPPFVLVLAPNGTRPPVSPRSLSSKVEREEVTPS